MRRAPALFGRHLTQDLELLGAGLLAGVHGSSLPESIPRAQVEINSSACAATIDA
jgi:hypothetical protein